MTRTAKLLVVDDQKEILDVTSEVLGSSGYTVTAARSGDEALRHLAGDPFDLVLLDINMPGMDGWEVLRLIRADDTLDGMPVVMFSVKGEMHDKIQSLQDGAAGYVTKPFMVDDLLDRIGTLLEGAPR